MTTAETVHGPGDEQPQYTVPPGSRLDWTLQGLDPAFALNELTLRQGPNVIYKDRQRQVIELRYGLVDGQPRTQRQVATAIGRRSRVLVSQAEFSALRTLRAIRDEYRPEMVFPRPRIYGIDNDYLHIPDRLKERAKREASYGFVIRPRHEYPQ